MRRAIHFGDSGQEQSCGLVDVRYTGVSKELLKIVVEVTFTNLKKFLKRKMAAVTIAVRTRQQGQDSPTLTNMDGVAAYALKMLRFKDKAERYLTR